MAIRPETAAAMAEARERANRLSMSPRVRPAQAPLPDDVREAILEQLEVLLAAVPGITGVYRDRGDLSNFQLPAVLLLDGSESNVMVDEAIRDKSVQFPGGIMDLRPHIILIPLPRDTPSNDSLGGIPAPIGPEMSQWRMNVCGAIENDPTLISYLYPTGQMSFLGFETDMEGDSPTLLGRMLFRYSFRYWKGPVRG